MLSVWFGDSTQGMVPDLFEALLVSGCKYKRSIMVTYSMTVKYTSMLIVKLKWAHTYVFKLRARMGNTLGNREFE